MGSCFLIPTGLHMSSRTSLSFPPAPIMVCSRPITQAGAQMLWLTMDPPPSALWQIPGSIPKMAGAGTGTRSTASHKLFFFQLHVKYTERLRDLPGGHIASGGRVAVSPRSPGLCSCVCNTPSSIKFTV